MNVYRICLSKHAGSLFASGRSNRWNPANKFVIYAAESRALACLENVVHRGMEGLDGDYSVMVIEISDVIQHQVISAGDLPENWYSRRNYPACQVIGNKWYEDQTSAVLKVPSAVVRTDSVFILNTQHPDFRDGLIRLAATEPFVFARIIDPDAG